MKLTKKGLFAAALVAACGISCLFRVAAAAENDGSGAECVSPTPVLSGGKAELRPPADFVLPSEPVSFSSDDYLITTDTDYMITVEDYVESDGKFVELLKGGVSVSGGESVCVTPTPVPSAGE